MGVLQVIDDVKVRQSLARLEELGSRVVLTGDLLYDAARVCALSSTAARRDFELPQNEQEKLAEQYAAHALELLAKARTAGSFKNRARLEQLQKDTDLDSLRSREDFKKLVADLEKEAKPSAR